MLKINGVAIATPKSFQVDISDLYADNAGRNAKGDMVADRVTTKRKLNCEWPPLSMSEISTLLQAVKNVYFNVEYPDPMEGEKITKTFYVGDRSMPVYMVKNGQVLWEGLKMNFIER